jgi:hypothetical protein
MIRSYLGCLSESFWRGIASLVTDILCLSFFENLDELAVSLHQGLVTRVEIGSGVFDLLTKGGQQSYSVLKFYDYALALVGHSEIACRSEQLTGFSRRRILSSAKGQVAYLKIFETRQITRRGYLTLAWARGLLRFDDVEYPAALESVLSFPGDLGVRQCHGYSVRSPENFYPDCSMQWSTTPRNGVLELSADCRGGTEFNQIPVPLFDILENLAQSFILEGCEHRSCISLDKPDLESIYTGPLFIHQSFHPKDSTTIGCVAVDGDNGLRLLTFGAQDPPFPMVFRGGSCLACALDVCRKAKSRLLIL